MEIYSGAGILSEEDDLYAAHLRKIRENFDIGCNILEIGGGAFPAFGILMAKEQIKLGKGTITVYDPELITQRQKYRNLILKREEFTFRENIDNYDLIVGIYPCEATENIITTACSNHKNFYVAMCGCVHFSFYQLQAMGIYPNLENYQRYIQTITLKN